MFEGDFEDMCANVFLLVSMGGLADLSSVYRRGTRTPIGVSGILIYTFINYQHNSWVIHFHRWGNFYVCVGYLFRK